MGLGQIFLNMWEITVKIQAHWKYLPLPPVKNMGKPAVDLVFLLENPCVNQQWTRCFHLSTILKNSWIYKNIPKSLTVQHTKHSGPKDFEWGVSVFYSTQLESVFAESSLLLRTLSSSVHLGSVFLFVLHSVVWSHTNTCYSSCSLYVVSILRLLSLWRTGISIFIFTP